MQNFIEILCHVVWTLQMIQFFSPNLNFENLALDMCVFEQSICCLKVFKVILLFCFISDLQWGLFWQWQEGQIVHRSCVPFLIQYIFGTVVLMCGVRSSWMKRQNINILVNNRLIFLTDSLIFLELTPRVPGSNQTGLHNPVRDLYFD